MALIQNKIKYLCIIVYQIYCVILSYIPFTFPQNSKCFLPNGTKNMHILASGPELQAVRFEYVILSKDLKKGWIHNRLLRTNISSHLERFNTKPETLENCFTGRGGLLPVQNSNIQKVDNGTIILT